MTGASDRLLNGRYEVLEIVGRGGEGTVLRALDRRHDRLVALKRRRVPDEFFQADRFLLEARTLLSLRPYPGLPLARDDFFEDNDHYLVLDWIEGIDLASFLAEHGKPGLPLATVLRWLAPVAEALTYLHQSEPVIVHGDVKPANLILTTAGDIVLVDLGMSSRGASGRGGTPGFRAPEAISESVPTRAVDVYGLAATAFALLTGAPPTGVLPDWEITDPVQAARLEAAIRRGMTTDPARRTPTPGEFVEELRAGWDAVPVSTGVLTYLSTDVVISGELWRDNPRDAIALRAEHALIVDSVLDDHGGRRLVDVPSADVVSAIFERAGDAVKAAVALQRAAVAQSIPARCALDTGEAVPEGGYVGATHARVAKIRELAEPGQVLLSDVTARLAAADLDAGAETVVLGPHRIVGFDQPATLLALCAPGIVVPLDPNVSPYPGLVSFQPEDCELFFGRQDIVEDLLGRLEGSPLVGVVGASGSGKSSVLRAGLAPQLSGAVVITPTEHPVHSISLVDADAPLVVDQLEELFTLCVDPAEAEEFVETLMKRSGKRVVAIRADMYGSLVRYPALASAVAADHLLLGPMTSDELRRAIEGPADVRGFVLESGLVELALNDVGSEPGILPHLAHALRETWLRRDGRTLTVAAYQTAGGVRGALTQTAETLYETLTDEDRRLLRSVMLQMVEVGSDLSISRRRMSLATLNTRHSGRDAEPLITRLAASRLVTITAEAVEPAHEALIRDWPRLRDWIAEDRDELRTQRMLVAAASEWDHRQRNPDDLFRGSKLGAAVEWSGSHTDELSDLEIDFIESGQRQEQSELLATQRTARRLRRLVTGLALVLVVALVATAVALVQRSRADQQAQTAQANTLSAQAIAVTPTQVDTALLLASEGYDRDPSLETSQGLATALNGARFLVRSHLPVPAGIGDLAITPGGDTLVALTYDGELVLVDTTTWEPVGSALVSGIESPFMVNFSHDGTKLAFGAADGVHVVNLDGSAVIPTIEGPQGLAGAFTDDDNKIVATFEGDNTAKVVDLTSGATVGEFAVDEGSFPIVGVRPGHDEVAIASFNGTTISTYRLDGTALAEPLEFADGAGGVIALAYAKDGSLLAAARGGRAVDLLDPDTLAPAAPSLTVRGGRVWDMSFAPDGAHLLVGSDDGSVLIYSLGEGRTEATVAGLEGGVLVEFVDENRFVAATATQSLEYDLRQVTAFGTATNHGQQIGDIVTAPSATTAFVVEEHRIVELGPDLGERDGSWQTPDFRAVAVAVAHDGRTIAVETFTVNPTQTEIAEGFINIVDVASGTTKARFAPLGSDLATRMEFSPDDSKLAVVTGAGYLTILDAADGTQLLAPVAADWRILLALRWSRDGSTVYVGGQQGAVREVDVVTGAVRREIELTPTISITDIDHVPGTAQLAVSSESGQVFVVDTTTLEQVGEPMTIGATSLMALAVSPDAQTVAAVSRDGALRLWDLASRTPIAPALTAHDHESTGVVFLSTGDLLSVGGDGTVVAWEISPDLWRTRACQLAGRNLTRSEWDRLISESSYHRTCDQYVAED